MRLFVAIYPPEDSARAMLRALKKLDPPIDARHRETPLEQIHMTVQFIGDREDRELDDVLESVRRSASGLGPFDLAPEHLITLPTRGTPRLVALQTNSPPQILELHRRLASRLARDPRKPDRFTPHFTLCRFQPAAKPRDLREPIDPAKLPPFRVDSISLMRSTLLPAGARHDLIERIGLS